MPVYSVKVARKDVMGFYRAGIRFTQTPKLLAVVDEPHAENEIDAIDLKILKDEKMLSVTEVKEAEATEAGTEPDAGGTPACSKNTLVIFSNIRKYFSNFLE
jgi:hypothetical protein